MAAMEPPRKRPTTFTIESIVGRSSPSPPSTSRSPPPGCRADISTGEGELSPSRKPPTEATGPTYTESSTTATADAVSGTTSAGRHLELLARFATPNIPEGPFSTPVIFDGNNVGAMTFAEALLRAGGHLPYSAAVELANHRGNEFASSALTPRLQEQASTLDGSGPPIGFTLFPGGSMWNPRDLVRRVPLPSQGWSAASLVHPLTAGVRPTAEHNYIRHPYSGK